MFKQNINHAFKFFLIRLDQILDSVLKIDSIRIKLNFIMHSRLFNN